MKNINRIALAAAAFGAFAAAPSASAGEPVLPLKQYVNYAKVINSSAEKDSTNAVSSAVAEVVKEAGDAVRQAVGEVAASVTAVSTFRSATDGQRAASVFASLVSAASGAGSDEAESLGFAKIAAAVGSLVSGGADFTAGGTDGLADAVAAEIKAALENVDETLSDLDVYAVKEVYEHALAALRGSSVKLREDSAEIAAAIGIGAGVGLSGSSAGSGPSSGLDDVLDRPTPTTLPGSGIFVGEITVPEKPVVKPRPKPTRPSPTPSTGGN